MKGLTIASTMGPGIRVDVPGDPRGRRGGLTPGRASRRPRTRGHGRGGSHRRASRDRNDDGTAADSLRPRTAAT